MYNPQQWRRDLVSRVACGDWAARRLLCRKGALSVGLAVNVSKSCVFGLHLPGTLPPCLAGYSVRYWSTYLGQTIKLIEGDEHMVSSLFRRATSAFFANRPLLTHRLAPRSRRLALFTSLVTASIRWSLCAVSVKQSNLTPLRVFFVTLLTWMLGGRAHPSWFAVECLQALRHAVKLWGRTFSETWDQLLARMVWCWVGHVLRMPSTSLVRSVLLGLRSTASLNTGLRRRRTEPNNSGHRNAIRYLRHRGIPVETALDRTSWQRCEDDWLRHNGIENLATPAAPAHVFAVPADQHFWEKRCLQGTFYGQQVFVADVGSLDSLTILELDRSEGWGKHTCSTWILLQPICSWNLCTRDGSHWQLFTYAYCCLKHPLASERMLLEAPFSCEFFQQNLIILLLNVIEMSRLQGTWVGEMKQINNNNTMFILLSTLVARLFSFTLSSIELAEKVMEGKRYIFFLIIVSE